MSLVAAHASIFWCIIVVGSASNGVHGNRQFLSQWQANLLDTTKTLDRLRSDLVLILQAAQISPLLPWFLCLKILVTLCRIPSADSRSICRFCHLVSCVKFCDTSPLQFPEKKPNQSDSHFSPFSSFLIVSFFALVSGFRLILWVYVFK